MNNILILALTLSVSPPAPAQNANRLSPPTALEQVRLELAEDAPLVTILLRDGRISAVLENKPTPAGFHISMLDERPHDQAQLRTVFTSKAKGITDQVVQHDGEGPCVD